jgi:fructan beta-fructosidase
MTLPRELKLTEHNGKPLLTGTVVKEIDQIASSWQKAETSLNVEDAYQLRLTLSMDKNAVITLSNAADERFVIDVNASSRTLTAHRTSVTGRTSFNGTFSVPSIQAPLNTNGDQVTLDLFVDQSSVELITQEGTMSMTNLVFPQSIYNRLEVSGADYEAQVRQLSRIWK